MKTQTKIMILLFTLTLALGALVLMYASDDALHRFRWFVFNDPLQLIADITLGLRTSNGLWYGWISLFAIIMIGVTGKLVYGAELRAFSNRLVEAEVAKAELETLLQDAMWKEKHARGAKDAAMHDLEAGLRKLMVAERQLYEDRQLLESQDKELNTLRSQANALTERPNEITPASVQERSELRDELRKTTDLLHEKDDALKELEKNFDEKVHTLESKLSVNEKTLRERGKELDAIRAQLTTTGAAKSHAESLLAEELRKEQQSLLAKDDALKELEKNLTAKVRALSVQLNEKQEILQGRSTELETLKTDVNVLTKQLADAASAKERAEKALQQELKKKTELLQSKDAAFKELRENSTASIYALENQLNDKDKVLRERDKELDTLRVQLTQTGVAKNQAESSLADSLRKEKQALQAKDAGLKELEKNLRGKLHVLETQLSEKQELLQNRNTELDALRSEVNILTGRLTDATTARERAEQVLQQDLKKKAELLQSKDATFKEELTNLNTKFQDLQNQLSGKDAALKDRNAELDALKAQLTKMGSSKKEFEDLLRQELSKAKDVLEAKNSTVKELEERLDKTGKALEHQRREQETLLSSRDRELATLRSEVGALKTHLSKTGPATERAQSLPQENPANQSLMKDLEESSKRVRALESMLSEKEDLLKVNDERMERLESELKEKRKALARHEIEVWQDIERRGLWKRRLAKFGISLKD
jgi:chromosome segregation ATPase